MINYPEEVCFLRAASVHHSSANELKIPPAGGGGGGSRADLGSDGPDSDIALFSLKIKRITRFPASVSTLG